MPFCFDLEIEGEFRQQGCMIVENLEAAVEQADSLAIELVVVRPELKSRAAHCASWK
jgi:hypothetical protein